MLALFLNHPPMFVAGEIALGVSLAMFIGALIDAIGRASETPRSHEVSDAPVWVKSTETRSGPRR